MLGREYQRDKLRVNAREIAQCVFFNGQSFKSKKILGTKAGTYKELKPITKTDPLGNGNQLNDDEPTPSRKSGVAKPLRGEMWVMASVY